MQKEINTKKTLEVSLSKDNLKFVLKNNSLKEKTVDVIFMYKNPLLEMPYTTVGDFERLFLRMFPECHQIKFSDSALNMVYGLADLNSQESTIFPPIDWPVI